jgi:hypothetical protein
MSDEISMTTLGSGDPVARFHETLHQGPVLKQTNPIARVLRSFAFRFMRPFISYQEQVNIASLHSVESLQDRMTAYQIDLARALADLRRAQRELDSQDHA